MWISRLGGVSMAKIKEALEGELSEPALKSMVVAQLAELAEGKHRLTCDGRGLYIRVAPPRGASWVFRYMVGRRSRTMGLGRYPDLSLGDAREEALAARRLLIAGQDPMEAWRQRRDAAKAQADGIRTLKECADAYIRDNEAGWKHVKTGGQWRATFSTYVHPLLGEKLPVAEVDTALVLKALKQSVKDRSGKVIGTLWNDKNPTAKRVRERLEAVLESARVKGYRHGDNPARWTGHLSHDLPAPATVTNEKRHPALPYLLIGDFIRDLRKLDYLSARGLEFLILTAVRSDVVAGATWGEINMADKEWLIPAARMKGKKNKGHAHRVPLSAPAMTILAERLKAAPMIDGKPDPAALVFPGQGGEKMSDATMRKACKSLGYREAETDGGELVVPHGFRSTFRDWAGENGIEENKVLELALAHAQSGVEPAYARGTLFERRRKVMEKWAEACAAVAKPKKKAA
jgi:integrase